MQVCYPNTAAKEEAATMAGPEGQEMSILEGCRTKVDPARLATCHSLTKDLLEASVRVWQPLSKWKVSEVKSGVRALPPRTSDGSIPLIGRLGGKQSWWFICGLGARGLVYHAWLASIIAGAMIKNDEDQIQPEELLAWKVVVASGEVKFDTV
ncbi:hypothetical protein CEUSTIGMA_g11445.t1 [Chlamydomonas eustigma]|uniref:FAD dependent oxidoreductase domain-containing protein n=1 Tax=Chlamydomonas eustigma TaxID=1157962 RepID=A0A250XMK5_9CHLO|nr:hypothetical protein CEUSTIGMA_g11445.t1 [Chlamydomonas eustigma]|eukprot:GAX84020.1 hypothetical protein CEUSTIGMA_g11445.t1 [Chlamydomonas eustigma]